jgi:caffeoyl-CoA O-methyltransferase
VDITDPSVEAYIKRLLGPHDEPVLLEMEAEGEERHFPIVGRMVGVVLEILARSIGAQRIFELGSGYGYSAYWFSRATGPSGELHLTDGDPENEKKALEYLSRAGLGGPITFHVGEAISTLEATGGEFDVIYNDIDKIDYAKAWRAARDRVRLGGFFISDNTLWSGRVTGDPGVEDPRPEWTQAIQDMNEAVSADERYLSTILPIRDGVTVAFRFA